MQRALSDQCGSGAGRWLTGSDEPQIPSQTAGARSAPEVIRLVVLMYERYPLSLRNVQDPARGARYRNLPRDGVPLWNRFGPLFAADVRRQRVSRMRGYRQWRWHLDEMYVRLNGEMVYLWRAVDQEGQVLRATSPGPGTRQLLLHS